MNLNTIGIIISREYSTRVKKKSFLVTTFLVPVLFAALCCIPALIMLFNKDEQKLIAVVDESAVVAPALVSNNEVQYAECVGITVDSLKAGFSESPYSAILHISPMDADNSVSVTAYSVKPIGSSLLSYMESQINGAIQDYRIAFYDIDKDKFEMVKSDIGIKTYTITEDGSDKISNVNVNMILSLGLGIIIFMFVTMFSSSVMQSVIEEKNTKVVEILLSSVKSVDLMFGKIVGVALVALTQFLLWIILTSALVTAVFGFVGKDEIMGSAAAGTEIVQQIPGADPAVMEQMAPVPQLNEMQETMQALANINLPEILLFFFIFFIFGYLLYASMFAAVGSAVENAEDSNQLQVPLTVPLMLAYFIAIYSWKAPDSALAVWGSMIPFTSPIVMLARIPFGVPVWQLLLSVGILVLTFLLMGWVSAKIYKVGILTSGKKATWKDLWKWLKQK